MYQSQEIFQNLSPEEINRTLQLADIAKKEIYTEDEADRFRECFSLIQQGKTDEEVIVLLPPVEVSSETANDKISQIATPKPKKSKKSNQEELKDIYELIADASTQIGSKITLTESLRILAICGFKEQEEYSHSESQIFIEACKSIKQQHKTFEQVAAELGTFQSTENESSQHPLDTVIETISDQTLAAREDLEKLIDKVTATQAEDIPGLIQSSYLKNIVLKSQQTGAERNLFNQLEERIINRISQKKQQTNQLSGVTWEMTPLPPSSPTPMLSPEESKNDMTGN